MDRSTLEAHQLRLLTSLLEAIQAGNPFYQSQLAGLSLKASSGERSLQRIVEQLPLTLKSALVADQLKHPPYGSNLSFPLSRYTRCHQTSGSSGAPIRWLDTPESWNWMLQNWATVYAAAGITAQDRIYFAFSFGPFLGFWTAFESAAQLGCLCLPGGGLNSIARLRSILDQKATALCCTPTYAAHLGELARQERLDLSQSAVRRIIVAGEPGGSIESTRQHLRSLWPGAEIFDHHGMTEVGPVTYPCPKHPGTLHVIERSYIAEILDPQSSRPTEPGQIGELVLTPLGRVGSPLLRYRTGDLVHPSDEPVCSCGTIDLALIGGVLSRTDDMVVVRGVNLYPSAVEEVLRRVGGIAEYQVALSNSGPLTEVKLTVEPDAACSDPESLRERVERELHAAFSLRFEIGLAACGSLPRFELKARRWGRAADVGRASSHRT